MSSDFYFEKWKNTLLQLEFIVKLDLEFQETKIHEKRLCEAVERLSGMLGQYMSIYNDIWECLDQNLQIQKTRYINTVLQAVVARISELKRELRKLEASDYQFLNKGLTLYKLTTYDTELKEIPAKIERPEHIQASIVEAFQRNNEKKRMIEEEKYKEDNTEVEATSNWWDTDEVEEKEDEYRETEKKKEVTPEQLEMKKFAALIQAQERSRQIIIERTRQYNKRITWEKELRGTLTPPAPLQIRERSAKLIQSVCRAYFEIKRQKHLQCKRDEILGLRLCVTPDNKLKEQVHKVKENRLIMKKKYEEAWKSEFETIKQSYINRRSDEIREDYRDYTRDWFKFWYDTIQFFRDIPEETNGGLIPIIDGSISTPLEWLDEYKDYKSQKSSAANKMKLKFEKLEAKRQQSMLKREQLIEKKLEEKLQRQLMKNPTKHPGFDYPGSKTTKQILTAIEDYLKDWSYLDTGNTIDVKEKSVKDVDIHNAYMEAKMDIAKSVSKEMRNELKLLKAALKKDYENNDGKMPEPMMKRKKREKKKCKAKVSTENIVDKLEDLAFRGFLVEYPKTKLEDFRGDPNFSGDEIRCKLGLALPLNGETRNIWWDRCREMIHGFHRILLIGPKNSGKTKLVHALASVNDAVLFELDPKLIRNEFAVAVYLNQIVNSVISCAKAVQPAVIHIRCVQRLYNKVPPEDKNVDLELIRRYFVTNLFKKISKTDQITVIGTCIDPWITKSKKLLKQFPNVVLLPNTLYSTVTQILRNWVINDHTVPRDLDISSLAYVLQGYSYGYLKNTLQKFLSAEIIVRIAAHGLTPREVYDYVLDNETESKVDYEKYLKWYSDKTTAGKKEKKHLQAQKEFKQALDEWTKKMEKKKKDKSERRNRI